MSVKKQKLNQKQKDLISEWMLDVQFKKRHLTTADRLLIIQYRKDGEYDVTGKDFLNTIRDKWIKYISIYKD
jgi:hypothetical protein